MPVGRGPCLTLADLAAQVNEALDGLDGISPTVTVGTVEVLSAGMPPYVVDSDPGPNVILDFGFPSGGVDGEDGAPGINPTVVVGDVAKLASDQDPYVVGTPTTDPFGLALDFGIPAGDDGEDGATPTFTIGTTTTLDPGLDATVDITTPLDPLNVELNFGIPRGQDGTGGGGAFQKPDVIVRYNGDETGTLVDSYNSSNVTIRPGPPDTLIDVSSIDFGEYAEAGQIWAASYSMKRGDYVLTHEIIPLKMLIAVPDVAITPDTTTFESSNFYLGHGRLPYDSNHDPISTITIENKGGVSADTSDEVAIYHDRSVGIDESDRWSTLPEYSGMAVVVITASINKAGITSGAVSASTQDGALMVKNGEASYTDAGVPAVTVVNISGTDIRASPEYPVALACDLQPDGTYLICNVMDFRGGPGFDPSLPQIWVHDANADNFKLTAFCYNAQRVSEVYINPSLTGLYYKTTDGACGEEETLIVPLGDCSTPPAPATQPGGAWEATSFNY